MPNFNFLRAFTRPSTDSRHRGYVDGPDRFGHNKFPARPRTPRNSWNPIVNTVQRDPRLPDSSSPWPIEREDEQTISDSESYDLIDDRSSSASFIHDSVTRVPNVQREEPRAVPHDPLGNNSRRDTHYTRHHYQDGSMAQRRPYTYSQTNKAFRRQDDSITDGSHDEAIALSHTASSDTGPLSSDVDSDVDPRGTSSTLPEQSQQARHTFIPYSETPFPSVDIPPPVVRNVPVRGHPELSNSGPRANHPLAPNFNTTRERPGGQNTFYVIPNGMNVIFRDEQGNEITRVGDFGHSRRNRRNRYREPLIFEDEHGRELYRTGDFGSTDSRARQAYRHTNRREYDPHEYDERSNISQDESNYATIYLDSRGRQIDNFSDRTASPAPSYERPGTSSTLYKNQASRKVFLIDYDGRQIPLSSMSSDVSSAMSSISDETSSHRSALSSGSYSEVTPDGVRRVYINP